MYAAAEKTALTKYNTIHMVGILLILHFRLMTMV